MMGGSLLRLLVVVAAIAAACAPAGAHDKTCQDPGMPLRDADWQAARPAHPLVGQVLWGDDPIAIPPGPCARSALQQLAAELWSVLAEGGIVLLGEVHDNPEHHLVRAGLLRSAPRTDPGERFVQPGAVFEHLRPGQQPALDDFYRQILRSDRRVTATDLLDRVEWKDSGWPAAEMFVPLFDAALDVNMAIFAGDPPRERIRALARGGKAVLDAKELERLNMSETMSRALLDALSAEIAQSHCGLMPDSALGALSLAQRYRDAHLAEALVKAAEMRGAAVLLAGNGHVRSDRAVPWYVRRMAPGRRVVSVTLLEVEDGKEEAASYLPRDPEGNLASDYVVFTPRQSRPDPCIAMRERFRSRAP